MVATITFGSTSIPATQVALADLGHRIRSFREPLNQSIRDAVIPAISENFATEGHGRWPPLAFSTVADKEEKGYPNRMLVRTKRMITVATSVGAWRFGADRESIALNMDSVPYAHFHIEGTVKMPARDFTEVSEEVADEVENIFTDYIAMRIARFHAMA